MSTDQPDADTMKGLTHARLLEVLTYDPATGVFVWTQRCGRMDKGKIAGSVKNRGYRIIKVDGVAYTAHRLAWFYIYQASPNCDLDHINGGRDDNRIANLREATRAQNCANRKANVSLKSGIKGAYFHRPGNKWKSAIKCNGRYFHLGYFSSAEEAHAAYAAKAQELFGEFARAA